jgi:hypothetical protein
MKMRCSGAVMLLGKFGVDRACIDGVGECHSVNQ